MIEHNNGKIMKYDEYSFNQISIEKMQDSHGVIIESSIINLPDEINIRVNDKGIKEIVMSVGFYLKFKPTGSINNKEK